MNPIISDTKTLTRIVTSINGTNTEIKLPFADTIRISSLDDIDGNGIYSGENLFTSDMYENQFK